MRTPKSCGRSMFRAVRPIKWRRHRRRLKPRVDSDLATPGRQSLLIVQSSPCIETTFRGADKACEALYRRPAKSLNYWLGWRDANPQPAARPSVVTSTTLTWRERQLEPPTCCAASVVTSTTLTWRER